MWLASLLFDKFTFFYHMFIQNNRCFYPLYTEDTLYTAYTVYTTLHNVPTINVCRRDYAEYNRSWYMILVSTHNIRVDRSTLSSQPGRVGRQHYCSYIEQSHKCTFVLQFTRIQNCLKTFENSHMVYLSLIYNNNLSESFLVDPDDHHAASSRAPNRIFKLLLLIELAYDLTQTWH
jgi:hypothetical protein